MAVRRVRRVHRILAGHALLYKLPYYVAVPAGAAVGTAVGYAASVPDTGPRRIALMVGAFLAIVLLALLAPQPTRKNASERGVPGPGARPHDRPDDSTTSDRGRSRAPGSNPASSLPFDAGNDSLCD